MKKPIIFLGVVLITLASCEGPSIHFSEPQPAGVRDMNTFPNKLQGVYLIGEGDEDYKVTFEVDAIITPDTYVDTLIMQPDASDEDLEQTLMRKGIGIAETKKYEVYSDTLILRLPTEKRFELGEDIILRKWKGKYFLNVIEDETISVMFLETTSDGLQLYLEMPYRDWEVVDPATADTVKYEMNEIAAGITRYDTIHENLIHITPTRKELRALIDAGFFQSEEGLNLIKINNE